MTRVVDTEEEQQAVYHLVCHDCPIESVDTGERKLREELEAHRTETGHNVEVAPITAVELE